MPLASLLFALLAVLVVISEASLWIGGSPLSIDGFEIALFATYGAASVLLWRKVRFAPIVGLAVSVVALFFLFDVILFLAPFLPTARPNLGDLVRFILFLGAPAVVNLVIVAVLGRVLLSNNRWRVP